MASKGDSAIESLMQHLGDTDACVVDGPNAVFGSELRDPEKGSGSQSFGASPDEALNFRGGASFMDETVEATPAAFEDAPMEEQEEIETQAPLDYVVQNLQCRTGASVGHWRVNLS